MSPRVVLITGGSSGFGYRTALRFARIGDRVYAGVRELKSSGALELERQAQGEGLTLRLIHLDVTVEESVKEALNLVRHEVGRVDVLINNAGFGYLGPVELFSIDEVRRQYETNVFGMLRMVKGVVPLMREQKSGVIINMSSINGLVPFPLFAVYSSSKQAIEALSAGLRFELAPFGIRVILIEPGSYPTNFTRNRRYPEEFNRPDNPYRTLIDKFARRYESLGVKSRSGLLYRFADPERVVNLIYKVANLRKPRLRYRVGLDASIYYWLYRLLPANIWESLLRRLYRW